MAATPPIVGLAAAAIIALIAAAPARAAEVVVYTARNEQLIKPIFAAFTRETGIDVRFQTGEAPALIQRLKSEGAQTPADLLMTVDAGELWHAAEQGLLQPTASAVLRKNVPAHLRDPSEQWFGLSVRARTIVYSTKRVEPAQLSTYEALAEPRWRGRLCLRTSKKVYNQSLVAMMIAEHGEERTEKVVRGWVANLATEPFANDTLLMQAIAAGQCDVGIVNTYYFGRLQREQADAPLALFWANQDAGGVHVNVSGAGVTRHARHVAEARRLLEWLSEGAAQQEFAGANLEYPANPAIATDPMVQAWGSYRANPINVSRAGEHQAAAVKLMDRAGYR